MYSTVDCRHSLSVTAVVENDNKYRIRAELKVMLHSGDKTLQNLVTIAGIRTSPLVWYMTY
jgi:hypothetical protein